MDYLYAINEARFKSVEDIKAEDKIGNKSRSNKSFLYTESLHFSNTNNSIYNYLCIYENYINNKIDNEEKIANHLNSIIPMNESAYKQVRAINEGKIGDKIKNKFNKIVAFVKNLLAKFMESISSFLLDEKDYLEKYKDIILKKQPKEENEYSYTGDYKIAVNRCINFQLPIFNYNNYVRILDKDDADVATYDCVHQIFFNAKEGFNFSKGDSISERCKEYFLAIDKGEQSGKFNDGHLNFTDMYNFCKNIKDIENIKRKDENYIETTTKAILSKMEENINNKQQNVNASYLDYDSTSSFIRENTSSSSQQPAQGNNQQPQQQAQGNNQQSATKSSNVKINSAIGKIYQDSKDRKNLNDNEIENKASGSKDDTINNITKANDRFLNIVQTIIAARCTALETIAKNYMAIIRAHVRSYVGNDKNKLDNKTPDSDIDYNNQQSQQPAQGNNQQSQQQAQGSS